MGNAARAAAPLKTKNSYRSLAIVKDALDLLAEKQKRENGFSEYVFASPTGGPISPDSVLNMLNRVLKRAGLPKVRFHDLRHTLATLALQNGVDIKTVSGMLGYYSAGFTLDTYTHITTSAQTKDILLPALSTSFRLISPYGTAHGSERHPKILPQLFAEKAKEST